MMKRLASPEKNVGKNHSTEIININFVNVTKLRCFGTTKAN